MKKPTQKIIGCMLLACMLLATGCFVEDKLYTKEVATVPSTIPGQPQITTTNLAPNPMVVTALELGRSVPVPYVPIAAAALSGIYAAYLHWRNARNLGKASQIHGALIDTAEILKNTLEGVSQTAHDAAMKEVVAHQAASGVREDIIPLVNART